jgi:cation diffusion facilitator CzcD-associated flavoprotein CzcO
MTEELPPAAIEHVDVLVIGAGLSGIGAAAQLRQRHPGRTVAVLESRDNIGGTWDLFRYPGIRSDSDMFTFGYEWRPWKSDVALADGDLIKTYIETVAEEYGVTPLIRYRHRVVRAAWDSSDARWTVTVEVGRADGTTETTTMTAGLVWSCAGYYRYDQGFQPVWPGMDEFRGEIVHPQHWPEDLDYRGKRVIVVGSGATAITLVPAMAPDAEHVTMLQRTPTYLLSRPGRDPLARRLERLPDRISYPIVRWSNILQAVLSFQVARRWPETAKKYIRKGVEQQVPEGFDVDTHFNPPYNPWEQRLCFVPDNDLFKAMRAGRASIVTGAIGSFTEGGVRLTSGEELAADVVVTATGFQLLLPLGGIELEVDGRLVDFRDRVSYKAMMLSEVPNFVFTIGYTNASWTLKADLVIDYVCRLLDHMDRHGYRTAMPPAPPEDMELVPLIDFKSGYVQRSLDKLPRQGDRAPWKLDQNYIRDRRMIRKAPIDDGVVVLK